MLKKFIEETAAFKQFIIDSKVVDTRPYVAREEPAQKREFIGISFGLFGAQGVLSPVTKRKRHVVGYLDVPYKVVGQDTVVPAGNWAEVISQLPPGTLICADVYTESRHFVSTLRFTKAPDGHWVEEIEEEAEKKKVVPEVKAA